MPLVLQDEKEGVKILDKPTRPTHRFAPGFESKKVLSKKKRSLVIRHAFPRERQKYPRKAETDGGGGRDRGCYSL